MLASADETMMVPLNLPAGSGVEGLGFNNSQCILNSMSFGVLIVEAGNLGGSHFGDSTAAVRGRVLVM